LTRRLNQKRAGALHAPACTAPVYQVGDLTLWQGQSSEGYSASFDRAGETESPVGGKTGGRRGRPACRVQSPRSKEQHYLWIAQTLPRISSHTQESEPLLSIRLAFTVHRTLPLK